MFDNFNYRCWTGKLTLKETLRLDRQEQERKQKACLHQDHNPPNHMHLNAGVYMHTCPNCGKKQEYIVPLIYY